MKLRYLLLLFILIFPASLYGEEIFDLNLEYSKDEFQRGIRAFHNTEYEMAILYFLKSLKFKDDNHLARLFLGEAYRKAGYEKSALYTWNTLLSMGYESRLLKKKISYLYNKRGLLTDIMIDKDYLLREDILGVYDGDKSALFLKPSQVTVGSNNHYYISSFLTGTVVELDPNLNVVRNYISKMPTLEKPFGIAVDKSGSVYVSDMANDVVLKLNQFNMVEKSIGYKGIGEGGLLGPKYLLLDEDENLYVVDSGNKRINKYNKEGNILFSFGNTGEFRLESPAGLYYENGKLYVCDKKLNTVLIFDKSGNYLESIGEDKLLKPVDITKDNLGRFLILCENNIWAYEESNGLWYIVDAPGKRLADGTSLTVDRENNILVTDFNSSRLLVLSLERHRYTNLNLHIERVFSQQFPTVHLALRVEKDDFSSPLELTTSNIAVFENGKYIETPALGYTKLKNDTTDITVIYDKNSNNVKYKDEFKLLMDRWVKGIKDETSVSFVSVKGSQPVLENDRRSTRLELLDSIDDQSSAAKTDIGSAIKFAVNQSLRRFSRKAIVIVTDSRETGGDFDKFKIEDSINLARNNDIPIYIVSFETGGLTDIFKNIAERTGGDYYRVYKRSDLQNLFKRIEESEGQELIISYKSKAISRFNEEPINITVEVNYQGMKGITQSIYYPEKK